MKKLRIITLFSALLAVLVAAQISCNSSSSGPSETTGHGGGHWSYSGATGPEHWGDLDPQWAACKSGTNQSPVDITDPVTHASADMEFHYKASAGTVMNNGHTIVFTPTDGGYILVSGKQYNLLQFHFHTPSEHLVNGSAYRMEGHLVSQAADGNYAVVGVFYDSGNGNNVVETVFGAVSDTENHETAVTAEVDANGLLPSGMAYYRYSGSLTTPPCTEGLVWSVFETPSTAAETDIQKMENLYGGNARPAQNLNGRTINHMM
ncbi:MAG: carbonic anhydrase family protein [Nitrospinota bacterium]|nr:carbonic anhydrase family protein [Nitrospinota bacterium]